MLFELENALAFVSIALEREEQASKRRNQEHARRCYENVRRHLKGNVTIELSTEVAAEMHSVKLGLQQLGISL
ncbi:MAG: hypothetical protein JST16_01060 [Bdellovibrionales bacterium]|nr:hypothetical protein [Bdellovibrionales bacterium]